MLTSATNLRTGSATRRAKRVVLRQIRSPFEPGGKRLIVHCSHHKAGTVWLGSILAEVGKYYGLRIHNGSPATVGKREILMSPDSRDDLSRLDDFRGSHIIRDPRDMVVSGYFYHLRTTESWARTPSPAYGGRSYQEFLRSLSQDDGLSAEIARSAPRVIDAMTSWNYRDKRFHELRYERLRSDEASGFRQLFRHYGFNREAVDRSVAIANNLSLEKVRTRRRHHIRSGQAGEWRSFFKDHHKESFKALTNDAAHSLGYEADSSW